jgi:low affinity Fe/Cu permease
MAMIETSTKMLVQAIRQSLTTLGVLTAHPLAFGIVGAYAVLWLIFQPQTFDWHAVAVLATWFMTLLIQRAEHRDTQAIHAKLDELLTANEAARTELSELDQEEPEEIERKRGKVKR